MRIRLLAVSVVIGFCGCASSPKPEARSEPPTGRVTSSVEILYTRGHNQHRLVASFENEKAVAQSFLDRQILAESSVDPTRYVNFLKKAAEFLDGKKQAWVEQVPCRTPFVVRIRMGAETRATTGCLTPDEGALSHLVRDGEFLLQRGATR